MFAKIGLTNSLVGLAILHTAIQLPFSLYILRNSFSAVPRELEEAAIMDGASSWQALVRVFIPSTVPGDRHGRAVRVHHVVERVPRRPGDDEQGRRASPCR